MSQSTQAKVAVVKVGGDVLLGDTERQGIAANVKDLVDNGWRVVVLHGGGPQTNRLQQKHGLVANKVGGRRITSEDDLVVVKQAICGEVNVELTQVLQQVGVNAFGCHGASGQLVQAVKRPPSVVSGGGPDPIDFGQVGDVVGINADLIHGLLDLGVVPVIATLGVESETAKVYNINADTTVVQIAKALKADLLLLTTAVGAIYRDLDQPDSRISQVNVEQAQGLIAEGVIQGGMIPKVEEAISVLKDGVKHIAIVGPQIQGAFLAVAKGEGSKGTVISG
jgi:acetylglutamate kinase